jgi:hypothetical protein
MKHQYFGDISDYKKYSVLRTISDTGQFKILVCWMLTSDDKRTDGENNIYLNNPKTWRSFEPDIFDFIHTQIILNKKKDLHTVELNNVIPNATYLWDIVPDNKKERKSFFDKVKHSINGQDIIFMDPDNGIATRSIVKGRKNSSKYIFWDEIGDLWNGDSSLLIYQHFPRVNRMEYTMRLVGEMRRRIEVKNIFSIATSYMVYFLLTKDQHKKRFESLKGDIDGKWKNEISVQYFDCG